MGHVIIAVELLKANMAEGSVQPAAEVLRVVEFIASGTRLA